MPRRIRYTMLAVTINSNRAAATEETERLYKEELKRFIQQDLAQADNWRTLIRIEPGFDAIDHIDLSAIGIERGAKRHRIHAHFVVTIQHHGKVLWKYTQPAWQRLLNEKLQYTRGSNVSVDLMDSRALNYTNKNAGTVKQLASLGIQDEVLL